MNPLERWIAFVEQRIWEQTTEELDRQAPLLEEQLKNDSIAPRSLLRELSDESLALAIQKAFWWVMAFEELFVRRYEEKLVRWFFRWGVRNPEDVRDMVQEIYGRFLANRLESFNAECNFRAYLYRTGSNLRLDTFRKRRPSTTPLVDGQDVPGRGERPEEEAASREFAAWLKEAINRLESPMREILRQTMEDVPAAEIAASLGLSTRQVYTHLFRARRQLECNLGLPSQIRLYTRRPKGTRETEDRSGVGEVAL